jgi:hypothetical protein
VGAAALESTGLDVTVHATSWAQYASEREDRYLPRVAVAKGAASDRTAVQASLPRVLLNAWTGPDDVGVSRHPDFLRTPCLGCLYGPRASEPSTAELIAVGIGLPAEQLEVEDMLCEGGVVDRSLVARVAAATGVREASLMPFVGTTVDVFHRCAVVQAAFDADGREMPFADGSRAFQAALAGVLLAAEIVIDAAIPGRLIPTLTRIDPLRPLADHLVMPAARDPYGRCLCGDADYREVYARKYSARRDH